MPLIIPFRLKPRNAPLNPDTRGNESLLSRLSASTTGIVFHCTGQQWMANSIRLGVQSHTPNRAARHLRRLATCSPSRCLRADTVPGNPPRSPDKVHWCVADFQSVANRPFYFASPDGQRYRHAAAEPPVRSPARPSFPFDSETKEVHRYLCIPSSASQSHREGLFPSQTPSLRKHTFLLLLLLHTTPRRAFDTQQ